MIVDANLAAGIANQALAYDQSQPHSFFAGSHKRLERLIKLSFIDASGVILYLYADTVVLMLSGKPHRAGPCLSGVKHQICQYLFQQNAGQRQR
ncbi:hypothetical protein D3C81_1744650 [compost metagenome]